MNEDNSAIALSEADDEKLRISGSRQLTSWMLEQKVSLIFTTYQTGKLFLVGLQPDGKLSIFERTFNRCMGLHANNQTFYMSSLYQLWRFENALQPGQLHDGYDRLYVPQHAYTTGDIDIHDIVVTDEGKVVFANTLFSCLATVSETHSFEPIWQPKFISKLAAEDRCHLNGIALRDGKPKYVTAVCQSDAHEAWRDYRKDGGIVIDVETDEIIADNLSMPHSPRYYQDKLWLLNSGTGYFGYIDEKTGKFEAVTFLPGYLRGLSFIGNFAVVGLSLSRDNATFSNLALDHNLREKKVEPRCAIEVIDLKTGDAVHTLRMEGIVSELYDVCVLPETIRPMAVGFKTDEIRRIITMDADLKQ